MGDGRDALMAFYYPQEGVRVEDVGQNEIASMSSINVQFFLKDGAPALSAKHVFDGCAWQTGLGGQVSLAAKVLRRYPMASAVVGAQQHTQKISESPIPGPTPALPARPSTWDLPQGDETGKQVPTTCLTVA